MSIVYPRNREGTAFPLAESQYNRRYEMSKEIIPSGLNIFSGENLAQKIRDLRKSRGMRQAELAKICGISQVSVSKWERGEKSATPTAKSLLKLSELAPESERQFWRDLAAEQVGFDLEASDLSGLPVFSQKLRIVPLVKEAARVDVLGGLSPNDIEKNLHLPEEWFMEGGIIRALRVQGEGVAKMIVVLDISRKDPDQLKGSLVAVQTSNGVEIRWLSRQTDGVDMLLPFHPNQPWKKLQKSGEYSLVGFVCCTMGDSAALPRPESRMQ